MVKDIFITSFLWSNRLDECRLQGETALEKLGRRNLFVTYLTLRIAESLQTIGTKLSCYDASNFVKIKLEDEVSTQMHPCFSNERDK